MATGSIATNEGVVSEYIPGRRNGVSIQQLLEDHMGRIEAAAKRVLGNDYEQVIDQLRQEVCIAIWRSMEKGENIEHWGGFIYNCAHKRALDILKQSRRQARREISLEALTADNDKTTDEQFRVTFEGGSFDQAVSLLEEELVKLPSTVRLTVLLRKGEGYSRAEVARMLNCSEATVDYRLRQGLSRLRKKLRLRGL